MSAGILRGSSIDLTTRVSSGRGGKPARLHTFNCASAARGSATMLVSLDTEAARSPAHQRRSEVRRIQWQSVAPAELSDHNGSCAALLAASLQFANCPPLCDTACPWPYWLLMRMLRAVGCDVDLKQSVSVSGMPPAMRAACWSDSRSASMHRCTATAAALCSGGVAPSAGASEELSAPLATWRPSHCCRSLCAKRGSAAACRFDKQDCSSTGSACVIRAYVLLRKLDVHSHSQSEPPPATVVLSTGARLENRRLDMGGRRRAR